MLLKLTSAFLGPFRFSPNCFTDIFPLINFKYLLIEIYLNFPFKFMIKTMYEHVLQTRLSQHLRFPYPTQGTPNSNPDKSAILNKVSPNISQRKQMVS